MRERGGKGRERESKIGGRGRERVGKERVKWEEHRRVMERERNEEMCQDKKRKAVIEWTKRKIVGRRGERRR